VAVAVAGGREERRDEVGWGSDVRTSRTAATRSGGGAEDEGKQVSSRGGRWRCKGRIFPDLSALFSFAAVRSCRGFRLVCVVDIVGCWVR
jgi:hypothetical protein